MNHIKWYCRRLLDAAKFEWDALDALLRDYYEFDHTALLAASYTPAAGERPKPQPERERRDPLEACREQATAMLRRLGKEAATQRAKIEMVQHLFAADIVAARAAGDHELMARLDRVRDEMIADINTGEEQT